MATQLDFIGIGTPYSLANRLGNTVTAAVAVGGTVGSATQIGGSQKITYVLTGTSSLKVPLVGGDTGCLIGDSFFVLNMSAAAIAVYAASNVAGSAVTFIASAGSAISVSVAVGRYAELMPITVSTWAVIAGANIP